MDDVTDTTPGVSGGDTAGNEQPVREIAVTDVLDELLAGFVTKDWATAGAWFVARDRFGINHFDITCPKIGTTFDAAACAYGGTTGMDNRQRRCGEKSCVAHHQLAVVKRLAVHLSFQAWVLAAKFDAARVAGMFHDQTVDDVGQLHVTARSLVDTVTTGGVHGPAISELLRTAMTAARPTFVTHLERCAAVDLGSCLAPPALRHKAVVPAGHIEAWLKVTHLLPVRWSQLDRSQTLLGGGRSQTLLAGVFGFDEAGQRVADDTVLWVPMVLVAASRFRREPASVWAAQDISAADRLLLVLLEDRTPLTAADAAAMIEVSQAVTATYHHPGATAVTS